MEIRELLTNALYDTEPDMATVRIIDVGPVKVAFRPDASKAEFVAFLREWTDGVKGEFRPMTLEQLAQGPSYIDLGAWLGTQRDAFLFIGLGVHHGLWQVGDPRAMGITDPKLIGEMMGVGMVYPVGFKPEMLEETVLSRLETP